MTISGNEDEFQRLLLSDVNLNDTDNDENSTLLLAAEKGENQFIVMLVIINKIQSDLVPKCVAHDQQPYSNLIQTLLRLYSLCAVLLSAQKLYHSFIVNS